MRKRRHTILLDCGATEIKDPRGATLRAELIPGAKGMVRGLHERGHTLALVADGYLDQLGIELEDYHRVVMVGNHLSSDIRGANRLGMISVWPGRCAGGIQ